MAVPVARVHLKVAHAALPALLPTPPKCKMLPPLQTTPHAVAAILPKPTLPKPSLADVDEGWDARKIKRSASAEPSVSSAAVLRSAAGVVRSAAGNGSSDPQRKNGTSPPPISGRADAMERWDAHKKAAVSPASSSSSSGTTSLASSSKWPISRTMTSAERWDVHKKHRPPQTDQQLDDGEGSSTASNDMDTEEEEEILWKPRALYAGPGFAGATPQPSMLPMPTAFLVHVA